MDYSTKPAASMTPSHMFQISKDYALHSCGHNVSETTDSGVVWQQTRPIFLDEMTVRVSCGQS